MRIIRLGGLLILCSVWGPPLVGAQVPADIVPLQSEKEQGLAVMSLAESGDANAQWMLGQAMLSPPATDPAAALVWLRRAADQGHPLAQRDLGLLYEAGLGVERDLQEAYFWYSLAAIHDSGRAGARRDELASGLTPEQLNEAHERVRSWGPRKEPTMAR